VRKELAELCDTGGHWFEDKPDIWSEIAMAIVEYANNFSAMSDLAPNTQTDWKEALAAALENARASLVRTQQAAGKLESYLKDLAGLQAPLTQSIQKGWDVLDQEEAAMTQIAEQMGKLEDAIGGLQADLDESSVDGGKKLVKTEVNEIYSILKDGKTSFTYLSLAGFFYSIGDTIYDLVATSNEVAEMSEKLAQLQTRASEEAQAAAGTKAVLRLLYRLLQRMGALTNLAPQICRMWQGEIEKLEIALAAIQSGAEPGSFAQALDLKGAAETWNTLKSTAQWTIDTPMTVSKGPSIVIPTPA
jgi:DNA repair exonuclease SbcCD ATPase subunit